MKVFLDIPVIKEITSTAVFCALLRSYLELLDPKYADLDVDKTQKGMPDSEKDVWTWTGGGMFLLTYICFPQLVESIIWHESSHYYCVSIASGMAGYILMTGESFGKTTRNILANVVVSAGIIRWSPQLFFNIIPKQIFDLFLVPRQATVGDVFDKLLNLSIVGVGLLIFPNRSQWTTKAFGGALFGVGLYYTLPEMVRRYISG